MDRRIADKKDVAVMERLRRESGRLAELDQARFRQAHGARPAVLIRKDASYATRSWVRRRFGRVPGLLDRLPWRTVEGASGVSFECIGFDDLVGILDGGGQDEAEIGAMGALSVRAVHTLSELSDHERRLLLSGDGGLEACFGAGLTAGGVGPDWESVEGLGQHAWVRAGDYGRPPRCVEDTFPIEVVYDHRQRAIVCVRSLRDDPGAIRKRDALRLQEAARSVDVARREWCSQSVGRTHLGDLLEEAVQALITKSLELESGLELAPDAERAVLLSASPAVQPPDIASEDVASPEPGSPSSSDTDEG